MAWICCVLASGDEHLAVRKSRGPGLRPTSIASRWLSSWRSTDRDPALAVEIERQLALRSYALLSPGEQARRQLEDEIATAPLTAGAVPGDTHRSWLAMQQPNFALLEAQIALALARRDGWPLHELAAADRHRARTGRPRRASSSRPSFAERLRSLLAMDGSACRGRG